MIWRWLICFSLLAPSPAATVTGRVELTGSRAPAVQKQRDYSGVVVWLEPVNATAPVTSRRAEMVQKNKTFLPHVLAIPVGSSVSFPNFDPIFHNAFSNFDGQLFDVGLYPPGTTRIVTFRRPGVVRVFCNIHPLMSAVIAVLTTPYFAVTGPAGTFDIKNVPPGDYQLHVFHERALEPALAAAERRVTVEGESLVVPSLRISEVGYVPVPHKNKYGKEYPAVPDDHVMYPGVRK